MIILRMCFLLALVSPLVFLISCEQQQNKIPETDKSSQKISSSVPAASPSEALITHPLLRESLAAKIVETPSEAIPTWRKYRTAKPALVVLANDPFLREIPPELWAQSTELVLQGSQQELIDKASRPRSNPLFFPQMAIMAALQADLVSEIIWVVPVPAEQENLDLDTFRSQMVAYGAIFAEEAEGLKQTDNSIQGNLYGHPFRAVTLKQLPKLNGPVLVHFDLSFFSPLYRHEIGTPLYPLLYQTLSSLRETGWQALDITISNSNLVGSMPLDTRFLANDLQTLFADPGQLDKPLPLQWQLRTDALYLGNFFKTDEIHAKYLTMQTAEPQNPAVKYALFQVERQRKENEKALNFLAEAVALDPAYAQAYLDLVPVALEANRLDAALKMLDNAEASLPDDPLIPLKKAEILSSTGHLPQLEEILGLAEKMSWSTTYYPDIQDYFKSLRTQAEQVAQTSNMQEVPKPGRN